jgi:zinc protease
MTTPEGREAMKTTVVSLPGPSGSLVLCETNRALPLVRLTAALRSGAAGDPPRQPGLASFAAEVARRGAAGLGREAIDDRLDAMGATLEIKTDVDSVRFEGVVLSRHLDAYLALLADVILRPDFAAPEVTRTRRELVGALDEIANDDQQLCGRFFAGHLFGDHPYGHPPEGTRAGLGRARAEDLRGHFAARTLGASLVFAATGDVGADDLAARLGRAFAALPATGSAGAGHPAATVIGEPPRPRGLRLQLVDKPDRRQAQIMFGQVGLRATDPDLVPLLVAITSFGGHGMKATLMDEVRTKRGLAYGAYMTLSQRVAPGSITGWVFSASGKTAVTLKLVLELYRRLAADGLDDQRLTFTRAFLAGSYAAELDDPERRLDACLTAEIVGLGPTFVAELPERVRAVTRAEVNAAIRRHVRPDDMAITIVATAARVRPLLERARLAPAALDVVPYGSE